MFGVRNVGLSTDRPTGVACRLAAETSIPEPVGDAKRAVPAGVGVSIPSVSAE